MPRRRFAIVTYDSDRIEQLSFQAEGASVAWIIVRALQGYDYQGLAAAKTTCSGDAGLSYERKLTRKLTQKAE
ncbi:hypothetical protein [Blastomonas sp.]|uniref:hypothetical protein n=1 Tax=Blastomonas sp. TaxID=1909299 RepID=UPI00406A5AD2